uniref:RAP domain-containing protein n=1 Tax=Chromera velia CCMP2878 TaxID=1169474 RepID=A0A0G4HF93_9ALVE|eukprot:Cvel_26875.t1-p1 / transcript=Cvel_26875.t1 / gene=Cvel_26875 / organism=Chromera_velia_CCMP2878 / gene_product=hypothetical protein / transcript_product=hypothetical protein / location=Cvel_scaffold3264:4318-8830(+) / protein_length=1159 / sequence_SO=supercontig / SO=protein_coding / is_pseudo=false
MSSNQRSPDPGDELAFVKKADMCRSREAVFGLLEKEGGATSSVSKACHAVYRLAKIGMSGGDGKKGDGREVSSTYLSWSRSDQQRFATLVSSLHVSLQSEKVISSLPSVRPAMLAWALAKSEFPDTKLLELLADRAPEWLPRGLSHHATALLYALGKAQVSRPALMRDLMPSLLTERLRRLDSRHIANILWSYGRLGERVPEPFLTLIADRMICPQVQKVWQPQHLSNVAWSMAVLGLNPVGGVFLREIVVGAVPLLPRFQFQNVANIQWAVVKIMRDDKGGQSREWLSDDEWVLAFCALVQEGKSLQRQWKRAAVKLEELAMALWASAHAFKIVSEKIVGAASGQCSESRREMHMGGEEKGISMLRKALTEFAAEGAETLGVLTRQARDAAAFSSSPAASEAMRRNFGLCVWALAVFGEFNLEVLTETAQRLTAEHPKMRSEFNSGDGMSPLTVAKVMPLVSLCRSAYAICRAFDRVRSPLSAPSVEFLDGKSLGGQETGLYQMRLAGKERELSVLLWQLSQLVSEDLRTIVYRLNGSLKRELTAGTPVDVLDPKAESEILEALNALLSGYTAAGVVHWEAARSAGAVASCVLELHTPREDCGLDVGVPISEEVLWFLQKTVLLLAPLGLCSPSNWQQGAAVGFRSEMEGGSRGNGFERKDGEEGDPVDLNAGMFFSRAAAFLEGSFHRRAGGLVPLSLSQEGESKSGETFRLISICEGAMPAVLLHALAMSGSLSPALLHEGVRQMRTRVASLFNNPTGVKGPRLLTGASLDEDWARSLQTAWVSARLSESQHNGFEEQEGEGEGEDTGEGQKRVTDGVVQLSTDDVVWGGGWEEGEDFVREASRWRRQELPATHKRCEAALQRLRHKFVVGKEIFPGLLTDFALPAERVAVQLEGPKERIICLSGPPPNSDKDSGDWGEVFESTEQSLSPKSRRGTSKEAGRQIWWQRDGGSRLVQGLIEATGWKVVFVPWTLFRPRGPGRSEDWRRRSEAAGLQALIEQAVEKGSHAESQVMMERGRESPLRYGNSQAGLQKDSSECGQDSILFPSGEFQQSRDCLAPKDPGVRRSEIDLNVSVNIGRVCDRTPAEGVHPPQLENPSPVHRGAVKSPFVSDSQNWGSSAGMPSRSSLPTLPLRPSFSSMKKKTSEPLRLQASPQG